MSTRHPLPKHTDRTTLRELTTTDLEPFQAYRSDPDVARFQSWDAMTDEQALAFIQQLDSDRFLALGPWFQIGIAARESDVLIGDIGICVDTQGEEAEIGFTLCQTYQKQGLGREAVQAATELIFDHTSVRRIIGITDERNHASIKLLEHLGMQRIDSVETVFRGEACIELTYALPRR